MKERTKRIKIIIYIIAAHRWKRQTTEANYSKKSKIPLCPQTQRGEAVYSSVSVMDDTAQDALPQVKPLMTNHHG